MYNETLLDLELFSDKEFMYAEIPISTLTVNETEFRSI